MFSEKYGYKPEKEIQYECISNELRCRIWNLFYQQEMRSGGILNKRFSESFNGEQTIEEKILDRMGFLIDTPSQNLTAGARLQSEILQHFSWYEIYDFIDIHLSLLEGENRIERIKQYNELLEQEKAGYRIVAGEVAPITNQSEIQEIDQAAITPYQPVNEHIRKALALYADVKLF